MLLSPHALNGNTVSPERLVNLATVLPLPGSNSVASMLRPRKSDLATLLPSGDKRCYSQGHMMEGLATLSLSRGKHTGNTDILCRQNSRGGWGCREGERFQLEAGDGGEGYATSITLTFLLCSMSYLLRAALPTQLKKKKNGWRSLPQVYYIFSHFFDLPN